MSGFQVCQEIKRDPKGRGVPVIMISGCFTEREDRIQGLELGADEFFSKPFDPYLFVARVKSILRSVVAVPSHI
jgi:DNA-binding response OmpR family regulator